MQRVNGRYPAANSLERRPVKDRLCEFTIPGWVLAFSAKLKFIVVLRRSVMSQSNRELHIDNKAVSTASHAPLRHFAWMLFKLIRST